MLAYVHAQDVFAAVHINADDHVHSLVDDMALLLDLVVNGVQKDHRVR